MEFASNTRYDIVSSTNQRWTYGNRTEEEVPPMHPNVHLLLISLSSV